MLQFLAGQFLRDYIRAIEYNLVFYLISYEASVFIIIRLVAVFGVRRSGYSG